VVFKIFTERGREKFSKFDIPYTKDMKIKDLTARVTKADGTSVEIDKKDIFDREIVKAGGIKVKAKSFAIPNIEPGVIVEYRYKEQIYDAGDKGMRPRFQRDIPIQALSYFYKPYNSREPNYQSYNFTDTKFVKDSKGFWLAKKTNVPSFKEEPRMPPDDQVKPWMLLTGVGLEITGASAFSITFTVKNPGNQNAYWGAVAVENAPLLKFMNKPNKEITAVAQQLTAGLSFPDDKLKKIYEFCQNEIRNTTFDTTLTDEDRKKLPPVKSLEDVLKRKQGSSQYVDMLFGALATAAGFESRIAFTGDRSKMFFRPAMTNESLIHPAAIAIRFGNGFKYYNPGMKFLPYGMLVWYEEDAWALIAGEKDYYWQETPLSSPTTTEVKRTGKFKLGEDGSLEGMVREEHSGHHGITYRMENYDESPGKREENLKEELKARVAGIEVSEISIDNLNETAKPLVLQYKVRVPNYAQKTGRRLFLQPGFFEFGEKPLFSSNTRKYDVFFRYPWSESDDIEIEMPKGFDLENAESPAPVADPQKIGSLQTSMSVKRGDVNSLKYTRKFHFGGGNNVLFNVATYPALKSLFEAFHSADAHTLTLRAQ